MRTKAFKIYQKGSLGERRHFQNIKQTRRGTWLENQDSILRTIILN
ncbi:hypothetical protein Gilli_0051 [Gillisia limnaea DSM 15749]|uniref:Uncharacterized protein n=1 Tax=Gillisia limnaea (strain DSM 15749 / LMG 21470 / R-8282) TaxID=865937 RepID=H2BQP0_GILLR|nr:hypothetical protein Gilli_0051 [Gillisia limnaea DSM 15749]